MVFGTRNEGGSFEPERFAIPEGPSRSDAGEKVVTRSAQEIRTCHEMIQSSIALTHLVLQLSLLRE